MKKGTAIITNGNFGSLKCKFIIHAIGPSVGINITGENIMELSNSLNESYKLANMNGITRISVPAISIGYFGFPKEKCANVIIETTKKWITDNASCIQEIRFTNYDEDVCLIFKEEFIRAFGM